MRDFFFGVIAVVALSACKNTTDPYLSREICDEWETVLMPMPQVTCVSGRCTTVVTLMLIPNCVRSHVETYANPNYQGGK